MCCRSRPKDLGPEADWTGDLAISVETALRQAVEQGHRLASEIKVLMLHGLLHLAGYDHETDAGEMERRERRVRARLGLPLGLIERSQARRKNKDAPNLGQPAHKNHRKLRRTAMTLLRSIDCCWRRWRRWPRTSAACMRSLARFWRAKSRRIWTRGRSGSSRSWG